MHHAETTSPLPPTPPKKVMFILEQQLLGNTFQQISVNRLFIPEQLQYMRSFVFQDKLLRVFSVLRIGFFSCHTTSKHKQMKLPLLVIMH